MFYFLYLKPLYCTCRKDMIYFNQGDAMLIEKSNSLYRYCRIPGMVLSAEGTLICYYECRKSVSDWADIDLKIIRSTDKGETWETVEIINSNGNTLNNPVMITAGDTIHFLYCKNYCRIFFRKSINDGISFSEPVDISAVFENSGIFHNAFAIGPGHGICHSGNLIIPVWISQNRAEPFAHSPTFITTLYSRDSGNSWHLGEPIGKDFFVNPSECAIAVTNENTILLSVRNHGKLRGFAESPDGFSRWSNIRLNENMPDPVCMGSMFSFGNSIYHINCASRDERENLTLKVSDDKFDSYESIFIDTPAGYSDIAVDSENIYILYEKDIENDGIYFIRKKK